LQVSGATVWSTGSDASLTANAYYDGANYRYINTNAASRVYHNTNGSIAWFTAPSGTAGNAITFTQAMTLDASGRLLLTDTSAPVGDAIFSAASSSTSDAAWTARVITRNTGNNTSVFMGNYRTNSTNTVASVAAHNAALTAWAPLYVNTIDGTAGNSGNVIMGGSLLVRKTTDDLTTPGFCASIQSGTFNGASMIKGGGTWGTNLFVGRTSGAGTGAYVEFWYNGTTTGTITTNGTTTAYNTSSDYRLKEDIAPMTGALAKVAALKPCTYKWKVDGSDGEGFIAHELQAVVPDAVTGEKDAVDAEGKPVYQGIDTSFLVATLTAAIQELKAEFDAYKASHP
jgi:hypothetical protein